MRNKFFTIFSISLLICSNIFSQFLNTPQVSPRQTITQEIGMSTVTIDYHRPAVKGREIWGKLVPYGLTTSQFGNGKPAPWRAGANENTVITFSDDVKVEGKDLKAGSYGLFMIPEVDEWTIIFSSNYTSWGSFFYEDSEDVLRVKVKPQSAEFTEWLSYNFDDLNLNSAIVSLQWEKLKIPFKVEFNSEKIAIKNIDNQLRNRAGFTWQGYQQAAFYSLQNNVSLDLGEKWIDKSIQMNENVNNRNLLGYIYMAQNKMDKAQKVFEENISKYPDNWNIYDSMAEFYVKIGDKVKGKEFYKKALEMAPENQKQRIREAIDKI
jgi:tetratricopeptide (TPR) repeat protein